MIWGHKYLAPPEPDIEIDELDDEIEDEPWHENPVIGADEFLDSRFSATSAAVASKPSYAGLPKAHVCALAICSAAR